MTPRERADEVLDWVEPFWRADPLPHQLSIRDRIEAAILAAVEKERERCAKIVENYSVDVNYDDIAAAIRTPDM